MLTKQELQPVLEVFLAEELTALGDAFAREVANVRDPVAIKTYMRIARVLKKRAKALLEAPPRLPAG